MAYGKLKLDYFYLIEKSLKPNIYLRISLNSENRPEMQLLEYIDIERVIMTVNSEQTNSRKILALVNEMTFGLNGGECLYQNTKARMKSLDDIVELGFEISFYKLNDGRILGTISKFYKNSLYDIFITTNDSLKDAFEALDKEIYDKYGNFPIYYDENRKNINAYAKKMIKTRRRLERHIKSSL